MTKTTTVTAGDQVYDLIGLDVSQAVGVLLLLLLLLAAGQSVSDKYLPVGTSFISPSGSAAVWIWSYRRGTQAVELHNASCTSYSSSGKGTISQF